MGNETIEAVTHEGMCCGCAACEAMCPKDAVAMQPDVYGYCIPAIDKEACVMCGLCLRTCPMYNAIKMLVRL